MKMSTLPDSKQTLIVLRAQRPINQANAMYLCNKFSSKAPFSHYTLFNSIGSPQS